MTAKCSKAAVGLGPSLTQAACRVVFNLEFINVRNDFGYVHVVFWLLADFECCVWLILHMASLNRFAADPSWDVHKQDGSVGQHVGITSAVSESENSVTSQLLM